MDNYFSVVLYFLSRNMNSARWSGCLALVASEKHSRTQTIPLSRIAAMMRGKGSCLLKPRHISSARACASVANIFFGLRAVKSNASINAFISFIRRKFENFLHSKLILCWAFLFKTLTLDNILCRSLLIKSPVVRRKQRRDFEAGDGSSPFYLEKGAEKPRCYDCKKLFLTKQKTDILFIPYSGTPIPRVSPRIESMKKKSVDFCGMGV